MFLEKVWIFQEHIICWGYHEKSASKTVTLHIILGYDPLIQVNLYIITQQGSVELDAERHEDDIICPHSNNFKFWNVSFQGNKMSINFLNDLQIVNKYLQFKMPNILFSKSCKYWLLWLLKPINTELFTLLISKVPLWPHLLEGPQWAYCQLICLVIGWLKR